MSSLPERHPIIRGELVYLRPSERTDLPAFVRWFNDAEVTHDLAMRAPMGEAAEAGWYEGMLARQGKTDYHFVICLLDDDRAICDFGFGELRLERIGLHVYAGNERARRSYEKAGFRHEATLRHAHFARGEHIDVHVMGLLRDEWAALPHRRSWESGA